MAVLAHPTQTELEFLTLSFNRFLDLKKEIMADKFWNKEANYRFFIIKELFAVYCEILKYPPVQYVIERESRPNYSDIGQGLFKAIRHILLHFPFFEKWDDVWINRSLVNLYSACPQFIDTFFRKYEGKPHLKYRFWEGEKKKMAYIMISFPRDYTQGEKVFLKDLLPEHDGMKFTTIFMWNILRLQIERITEE